MALLNAPVHELVERAWKELDSDELVDLCCRIISTYSWRGHEKACADVLATWMRERGFDDVVVQEFETSRANVIGKLQGSGGGPSLMFCGHLDTSYAGIEELDRPQVGRFAGSRGYRAKAEIDGDVIWGLGATNMKGSIAAQTYALHMIRKAGISLPGDVYASGVGGETECTPIRALLNTFEGPSFRGAGIGARYLITHGYQPDLAIVTEPSAFRVMRGRPGYIWLRLTTEGHHAYVPFRGDNRDAATAIGRMAQVILHLETHEPAYAARHAFHLGEDEGFIVPHYGIGGIDCGWPYKPGFIPGICQSYMDVRAEPGRTAPEVISEIRDLITKTGIKCEIEPYITKMPASLTASDAFLVREAKAVYEYVFGVKHSPSPTSGMSSFTDDSSIFRQVGIQAITWGPIDVERDPRYLECAAAYGSDGELITIGDLVQSAKVYAAAAIHLCSRSREEAVAQAGVMAR